MTSRFVYVTLEVLLVVMTTTHSVTGTQLNYTVEEEQPPSTPLGNVLQDSSISDHLTDEQVTDLRFNILKKGNPDASYIDIDYRTGELRTATR